MLLRVAAWEHGAIVVLRDDAAITGLGRGAFARGGLDDAAIARTVDAVARFADAARALGCEDVRVVGTSALRDAPDRARFVDAVRARTGLEVEVIDGAREAALTFRGACDGLDVRPGATVVVVDVGGGSTEVARGRAGDAVERAVSLDVGSVRLLPDVAADPPSAASLAALRARIAAAVTAASPPFAPGADLVALAGTALTVGAFVLGGRHDALGALHGARLRPAAVAEAAGAIASMTLAERAAHPAIGPERADVVVPGAAILAVITSTSRASEVHLSDGGVRQGLLRESLDRAPFSG